MTETKRLRLETTIDAPLETVWDTMFDPDGYRAWTVAFSEGSYYDGSWEEGGRIHFLSPSGDGMVAEIAESRAHEFVSIRHLGYVFGGVEDTESDEVRAWAPAYENYTFEAMPEGTRLVVDQDVLPAYEQAMTDTWKKAFELLRELCESKETGE